MDTWMKIFCRKSRTHGHHWMLFHLLLEMLCWAASVASCLWVSPPSVLSSTVTVRTKLKETEKCALLGWDQPTNLSLGLLLQNAFGHFWVIFAVFGWIGAKMIALYTHSTSSVNTSDSVPLAHALTLPPICLTDDVVWFGSFILNTFLFPSFWYNLLSTLAFSWCVLEKSSLERNKWLPTYYWTLCIYIYFVSRKMVWWLAPSPHSKKTLYYGFSA